MQVVRFDANVQTLWQVIRGKSGCWVAICDPLSLTVEADTYEELAHLVVHSIDDLMRDLLASGELPRFLLAQGWTPTDNIPQAVPHEGIKFDIPFDFEPMSNGGERRAVG